MKTVPDSTSPETPVRSSGEPTIIRVRKRKNYVVVAQETVEDERLDARSLSFLIYLLSKPDDWKVQPADLGRRFNLGRDAVWDGMRTLQQAGYAQRRGVREGGRFVAWETVVMERPDEDREPSPLTENPGVVPPLTALPGTAEPSTVNPTRSKEGSLDIQPSAFEAPSPAPPSKRKDKPAARVKTPPNPATQELVAHFCAAAANLPALLSQRGYVAQTIKKLLSEGSTPDQIRIGLDRAVATNRVNGLVAAVAGVQKEELRKPAPKDSPIARALSGQAPLRRFTDDDDLPTIGEMAHELGAL
jgi:hypothetical protein